MSIREQIKKQLDELPPDQLMAVWSVIKAMRPPKYQRVEDIPVIFTEEQGEELQKIIREEFGKIEGEW